MCSPKPNDFNWLRKKTEFFTVRPIHVADYVEELQKIRSKPTVKQHLAAIRMLFDWLVIGQVMETNPAHSVCENGTATSYQLGTAPEHRVDWSNHDVYTREYHSKREVFRNRHVQIISATHKARRQLSVSCGTRRGHFWPSARGSLSPSLMTATIALPSAKGAGIRSLG